DGVDHLRQEPGQHHRLRPGCDQRAAELGDQHHRSDHARRARLQLRPRREWPGGLQQRAARGERRRDLLGLLPDAPADVRRRVPLQVLLELRLRKAGWAASREAGGLSFCGSGGVAASFASMGAQLDLITIGRSSVDLYGEQVGGRLEDMASFAKYVGGSPTNTAVGAARLGLNAAVITRVGDDHFGRFIREALAREGVDVSAVPLDPARLTALAILGIRDRETFPLLFYRRDCADMALCEADIDEAFIASARAVLISGTHLSTPEVFAASLKAARLARAAGAKVVFDIDYRPVLWGLAPLDSGENRFVADAAVTARLREAAALCDLIVGTEEEFQILGGEADVEAALHAVRAETDALLVCKRGPLGCVAFEGPVGRGFADGVARSGVEIEVFNVLGAGDAFMAGFLAAWLRGKPVATACDYANACGALVVSRHGCAPAMPTARELDHFMTHGSPTSRLREDALLEHIHWATTRRPDYP